MVPSVINMSYYLISIHAPARGATVFRVSSVAFNPIFQSTLPRGERPLEFMQGRATGRISIHAPARGATICRQGSELRKRISIHAPARGATLFQGGVVHNFDISIHAPARGATTFGSHVSFKFGISIHAPARGATSILSKIHPMFLTISHNASSFSSFPFHSFLPHLLNSSTFCALFQVRISRAFSVYYRFAPKKSTPDL